jgi:hypothetical protein
MTLLETFFDVPAEKLIGFMMIIGFMAPEDELAKKVFVFMMVMAFFFCAFRRGLFSSAADHFVKKTLEQDALIRKMRNDFDIMQQKGVEAQIQTTEQLRQVTTEQLRLKNVRIAGLSSRKTPDNTGSRC